MKCQAQDSGSAVCNKAMTDEEQQQDGMCSFCADNIWTEIREGTDWYHHENKTGDV